jgi:apolipoprotein D and lipocalin family protein
MTSPGKLDEDIARAEAGLVERQARLRRDGTAVAAALRRSVPLWLGGAALVMLGATLGSRWLRRSGAATSAVATALPRAAREGAGRAAGEPHWAPWLALAWPLLPGQLRRRLGPAEGVPLLAFALTLLQKALKTIKSSNAHAAQYPSLQTMPQVDLQRYAGTWFEIARLPAPFEGTCESDITATYTPRQAGRIDVLNRCRRRSGRLATARGTARVQAGSGEAKLRVSLWPAWLRWLPVAWADYWILWVDESYSQALVGSPSRRYLWVLAREPALPALTLQSIVQRAVTQGFDTTRLHVNDNEVPMAFQDTQPADAS